MAWTCKKCAAEMEEVEDIALKYGDMELPEAEGLRCPVCGMEYLVSDYVTTMLNGAEQMLEGK